MAAFAIVVIANSVIVFDAFVWKMMPGAWLVEPPVLNNGPWSTTVTSDQPRTDQLVGERAADDPGTDDHDTGRRGHRWPSR